MNQSTMKGFKKNILITVSYCFIVVGGYSQLNNTENLGFNPPSLKWRKINTPTGKIIYQQGLDSMALRIAGIMNEQRENDSMIVGSGKTKKVPVVTPGLLLKIALNN